MPPRTSRTYRKWVACFTIGELVGFGGLPALGGLTAFGLTTTWPPELRSLTLYGSAVVGGFGEGAVLAWFQLLVLRDALPALDRRKWVLATGFAAAFAWLLGYLAPTLDDLIGLSAIAQIAIWIPAGVLILLSIGTAQAWALRGIVARPQRWIVANAVGWLCGLPWTFVLPALVPEGSPLFIWVAAFVIAAILMGLTVGIVTGRTLVWLTTTAAS